MLRRVVEDQVELSPSLSSPPGALASLRAVVLLAGTVGENRLHRATGRNLVDLPVTQSDTLLDLWRRELLDLANRHTLSALPVRVMLGRQASPVTLKGSPEPLIMRMEQDPFDYRGTGGLLSDLAREYEDDQFILVANAAQVLLHSVADMAQALAKRNVDIALLADPAGVPGGLMLIRCGCLRGIQPVGYVDLKEQALPTIAKSFDVRVVRLDQPMGMPIRTQRHYLDALRTYYRLASGQVGAVALWQEEDWQASFGLVESGAQVAQSATIHDSVVLRGAVVEPDAVVVRSIVCESAVVARGVSAMDCFVTSKAGGS